MENEKEISHLPGEEPAAGIAEDFSYEEFDISKFDFTIRDPGEDPEPVSPPPPKPVPEPPAKNERPKKEPKPVPVRAPKPAKESRRPLTRKQLLGKGKRYLHYALRPMGVYEAISEAYWPAFLLGSCLFGGGLYLLAGMDWVRADLLTFGKMWAFVLAGLLVGGLAALAFAGGTALLARICHTDGVSPLRLLSAAAGAAVFPACLLIAGLLTGLLFGASVFVAFGTLALLWWIFSLTEFLKDLFGDRPAAVLTFIILWGIGLFSVVSLTFSMK